MNTVPTPPQPGESHPHYAMITGLLGLAAFLTDRPDLPIGEYDHCDLIITALQDSDSEAIAYIKEIARVLDVELRWRDADHVEARREFGPRVSVFGQAALSAAMKRYHEDREIITTARKQQDAAAAETVELVVVVDDQAPVVEQLPAAAAPVDEGQADGDAGAASGPQDRAAREIHAAAAVADESVQPCGECDGSGSGFAGECTSCWGSGRVLAQPPKCSTCKGAMVTTDAFGLPTGDPCGSCHGTGYEQPAVSAW